MFDDEDDDFMSDDEPRMFPEFINMLNSGKYSSIDELCNEEGINHDELYMDEDDFFKNLTEDGSDSLLNLVGVVAGVAITAGTIYATKKILDKRKRTLKSR